MTAAPFTRLDYHSAMIWSVRHWLVFCPLLCLGCSSFERDFRAASAAPGGSVRAFIGTWQSDQGHGSGQLKAIVTRPADGSCSVRFLATYWGCFRARYDIPMQIEGQAIRGQADLGWLAGGVYQYEGELTADRFRVRYQSEFDKGTFDLVPAGP